ncbi:hypothetical protein MHBO_001116 [Bonamia ostreae]|uniref:Sushi domain-containing protein n=1 Tax=Bonamia ostreae TaxID=126728 RepID=A0ABV2AI22_9EUKA
MYFETLQNFLEADKDINFYIKSALEYNNGIPKTLKYATTKDLNCKCAGLKPSTCLNEADFKTNKLVMQDVRSANALIMYVSGNINEEKTYLYDENVIISSIMSTVVRQADKSLEQQLIDLTKSFSEPVANLAFKENYWKSASMTYRYIKSLCNQNTAICPNVTGKWGFAYGNPDNMAGAELVFECADGYKEPEKKTICVEDNYQKVVEWNGEIKCTKIG